MSTLLQKYQYNILQRPIRTFAMQSSFMMTLGDIISQQAIERKGWENHDIPRSFRTFVYGVCIGGPVMGSWFGFINRTITIKNRWAATGTRVIVDQTLFSPAILAVFMGGISLLEGRTIPEIQEKFHESYYNGLMNSYRYWPFVSLFTFAVIPLHYRPIVNSGFGIIWNAYLSHLNQESLQALKLAHPTIIQTNTL